MRAITGEALAQKTTLPTHKNIPRFGHFFMILLTESLVLLIVFVMGWTSFSLGRLVMRSTDPSPDPLPCLSVDMVTTSPRMQPILLHICIQLHIILKINNFM